jgi:hypothetical protein
VANDQSMKRYWVERRRGATKHCRTGERIYRNSDQSQEAWRFLTAAGTKKLSKTIKKA